MNIRRRERERKRKRGRSRKAYSTELQREERRGAIKWRREEGKGAIVNELRNSKSLEWERKRKIGMKRQGGGGRSIVFGEPRSA